MNQIFLTNKSGYIRLKFRLFLPVAIIIIIVVALAAAFIINKSVITFNEQTENNLLLQVRTISGMFERERKLKLEKVQTNLKILHDFFFREALIISDDSMRVSIENQNTNKAHTTDLHKWYLGGTEIHNNETFVDQIAKLTGGTFTVFQKSDSGYVRIATNVLRKDGTRASLTFIPNNSSVVQTIEQGKSYTGRAYVVSDWYITSYEPIYFNDEIVGMLYAGDMEKDLVELRKILYELKPGNSGYPFVFDKTGNVIIHPVLEGQNWKDSTLFQQFAAQKEGCIHYEFNGDHKTAAFTYFDDFEFYIAASVITKEETDSFVKRTVLTSVVIAIIFIIVIMMFIYFIANERITIFLRQLDISNKRLINTKEALKQSEDRFQKLFDSTGDEIYVTDMNENIIEVNEVACKSLGYSRDELLSMKMSEIKTPKYVPLVAVNRKKIYEIGKYTFESEHVTKSGIVMPVELTSRVVEYNNEKLILSVSRNIAERKEKEREILTAVISAEERERERFAKDMHDGLGPLLSTIKLYVNELKSPGIEDEERENLVKTSNEIIDEAISSTRTISNNLMPRVIHKYGVIKALEAFIEKVNRTNKIKILLSVKDVRERFDQGIELIIFRVISELINNTLKHANAENIHIRFAESDKKILIDFTDDGSGFNITEVMKSESGGTGLKNIISRIKSINGLCTFESFPEKGFSIKIEMSI